MRGAASEFLALAHDSALEESAAFLTQERRSVEVSPKSFLEHARTFAWLLSKRHSRLHLQLSRLESGLQKLRDTSTQADDLKVQLANQEVELGDRRGAMEALLERIRTETGQVTRERFLASEEETKVAAINEQVATRRKDCEEDLARAEPALVAAQEALNTLNKGNLTELRSFGSPPVAVRNVTSAVMVLMAPEGKIPKDLSWRSAKLMMSKVDNFLDSLVHFDKNHIHENSLRCVQSYLRSPDFKPEVVISKSQAAAGLCSWVINVLKYYEVYCDVEPKRRALSAANAEYKVAKEKLDNIQAKVSAVEAQLSGLRAEYDQATEEKSQCELQAQRTAQSIALADRLLSGLGSERERWAEMAAEFRARGLALPADSLLASAFAAHLGPFTGPFRRRLLAECWRPFLASKSELWKEEGEEECPKEPADPLDVLLEEVGGKGGAPDWIQRGLPGDRASLENAAILRTALEGRRRWPLLVDPQAQAMLWIKAMHGSNLKVVRTHQKGYLDVIEDALSAGQVILIENLEESIDPLLNPLIACNPIKKGTALKLGNKEVPFHPDFRLILHTKLSNPRYGPEVQAETTLVNFTVTLEGLAEQLLAEVVTRERPHLEEKKTELRCQQAEFEILLRSLEDRLLERLGAPSQDGDSVASEALVEELEATKETAAQTRVKAHEARETEAQIDEARDRFRPAAQRASLLYFAIVDLARLSPVYLFSLKAFRCVFVRAIEGCDGKEEEVECRVQLLSDSVTFRVFTHATRGLFEKDKLAFATHLAFQILRSEGNVPADESEFLLRASLTEGAFVDSPLDLVSADSWAAIRSLSSLEGFQSLERDLEAAPKRWRKWVEAERPEREPLPPEWQEKATPLQRLCILRCLRPDRIICALRDFVSARLGAEFVSSKSLDLGEALMECDKATPMLFLLSPGADPLADLERLGRERGFSTALNNFHNVSLGQGQEPVAEEAIDLAAQEGHWVVLQNIHLVRKWLPFMEKKLEVLSGHEQVHNDLRIFLTAKPPEDSLEAVPPGILESCLKVTNEPPKGMRANLHKALDSFSQEMLESSSREVEFRSLLFTLCYFHAVVTERRKFGPQGWNYPYPFCDSDLVISASILHNHLELTGCGGGGNLPWEDLRFLFGEIMYGGHITDDWDRKLCAAYLRRFFNSEQLEPDTELCPGFGSPPMLDLAGYHRFVDENLPSEEPALYGLHRNAEVGLLTDASDTLLAALHDLRPPVPPPATTTTAPPPAGGLVSIPVAPTEEKIRQTSEDILEKLPPEFQLEELSGGRGVVPTPFTVVALQECQRFNVLLAVIGESLSHLDLGLKGELPLSAEMEELSEALEADSVPVSWRAYPSLAPLGSWFTDLLHRHKALSRWVTGSAGEFRLPAAVWLGGLFAPQSFLTAVAQTAARKHDLPLDRLALHPEITKRAPEDFTEAPREGANVCGLFMEGGRWDVSRGCIADQMPKELHPPMPVISLRAILADKLDVRHAYLCPVYATRKRGSTFVWEFPLPTTDHPDKWTIAGVSLLLNV